MWFMDWVNSVAGSKLQVKTDLKKTLQKRTAQHSPKKPSETLNDDSGSSLENDRMKVDERKPKTDITSSLSVDVSKVCLIAMFRWHMLLSLSPRFNGHFPGEPGSAGIHWSKGWWRRRRQLDYRSYKSCKAPVKIITTKKPTSSFSTGRMPFLSRNQQCQSTEGKKITFHGLAYPKLTRVSSNFVSDH